MTGLETKKARILVVDDDEAARYTLARILQEAGYEVVEAATGKECLNELSREQADLLVLDIKLPDVSGIDLCRQLKAAPATALMPIIHKSALLTASDDRVAGLDSGADVYLTTPINPRELLAEVQALLRARRAENRLLKATEAALEAETALVHTGAQLEAALGSMTDAVLISDAAGNFIHLNGAFAAFHRFPSKAECLKNLEQYPALLEVMAPEGSIVPVKSWPIYRALAGEMATNEEFRVRRKDTGQAWFASYSFAPLRDQTGAIAGAVLVARDITQRKAAEEELRQLHQRLQYHLQNTPLGVIEFDDQLRISGWSEGAKHIFGWEAGEVLGRAMWEVPWIYEEDRPAVAKVSQGLETGRTVRSVSPNRNLRKDGKVVWCEWYNSSLTDASGKMQSIQSLVLDVTERRRAEEALQRSEELFRNIYEHAGTGIAIADLNGRFIQCNSAFATIVGYSQRELDGIAFSDLVYPPDRAENVAANRHLLERHLQFYEIENRYLRRDDEIVWVRKVVSLLLDEKGKPALLMALVTDITERRRAEAALRESEEQFRAMFTVSSFGQVLADPFTGRFLRVNQAMCRITGYSEAQLLSRTIAEITHPDDRARDAENFARMAAGASSSYDTEKRYIRPDGQVIWIHLSANVIRDLEGRPCRTTAVIQDITDRKNAETALRESEQRLRLAQTAGQIGIYDYHPQTGELIWDQRMRELWGLEPNAPINYEVFLARVHVEDREATHATVQQALNASGHGHYQAEYRVVHSGHTRWVAAAGQASFQEGKAVRLIGTVHDITERREFQTELERLVAERTARLHEMVAELEHFSYSITHDMRAPLRAMRGFAEIANEMCAACDQTEVKQFLRQIIVSAERMDLLITDSLNYSQTVRQTLAVVPVDLDELLLGMLDTYPQFLANRHNIQVRGKLPAVMGNEAALTQCFSNLIGNALKFVEPGKDPRVTIRADLVSNPSPEGMSASYEAAQPSGMFSPAVRPDSAQPSLHAPGWVRLWVEDEGIGIPEVMKPRIFNMFIRGSSNYEGTGIGLALVRKVVHKMGGRLGVESKPDQGSRFWIELRAAPSRP